MKANKGNETPCPNPVSGERCQVCGAAYVCREPWRKESNQDERARAKAAWEAWEAKPATNAP
jgi:NMD protein affecting ribosome stability and mRNA decay